MQHNLFIILLHQLLIYPCFYNYIPSTLKRIGLGLVLLVVINIILTVLAGIGNYSFGHMFYCLKSGMCVCVCTGSRYDVSVLFQI